MKSISSNPIEAVRTGLILTVPFWMLIALSTPILAPVKWFIGWSLSSFDSPKWNLFGSILLLMICVLGFIGSIIIALPLFRKNAEGQRSFYPLNAILALAMALFFAYLVISFGIEVYECDLLKIPNCD
jgi:hypothetical protein